MRKLTDLDSTELKGLLDLSCPISSGSGLDDFRSNALQFLLDAFSSPAGNFFIAENDAKTLNISNVLTHNLDKSAFGPYRDYYQYLDPFLQRPLYSIGATLLNEIVDFHHFLRGEYYNDFIKPQGIYHQIGMSLVAGGRCVGVIALFRPETGLNFSAEDKEKASLMLPYLASGLERALIAEYTRQRKWILESSLRVLGGHGIVVLDTEMNVVFANEEAQLVVGSGELRGTCNGRTMADLPFPEELSALCARTARRLSSAGEVPETPQELALVNPTGQAWRAEVRVISGYFFGEKAHFIVVHLGMEKAVSMPGVDLSERYQLTTRECEIVEEAIRGARNAQIAERLFISIHTVENHLKNVFRKIGVRSRAELCGKLLAGGPRTPAKKQSSPAGAADRHRRLRS
jgi:DNA-binding CsgD family transcriptional regulator